MNPNVKTLEQYSPIRQQQLAEYHAEQETEEKRKRGLETPVTVVPVKTQIARIKKLLNDCTAINVPLMLGTNGNTEAIVAGELDYKLNELYQLIKDVREVKKYSGKLIS